MTTQDFPYNYNGTRTTHSFGFVRSSVWANDAGALAFTYVFNNLEPFPERAAHGYRPGDDQRLDESLDRRHDFERRVR